MRIAIPIWENGISPVMDTASRMLIIEVENQREALRFETYLNDRDLYRRCFSIRNLGVDILICGAISRPYFRRLMASGVHVIPGISGQTEDVLEAYLQGTLSHSRHSMPGCRGDHFSGCIKQATLEKPNNRVIKGKRKSLRKADKIL